MMSTNPAIAAPQVMQQTVINQAAGASSASTVQSSIEKISVTTSNLECEFNRDNNASNVMGRVPDKVNFIIKMGPLVTNNLQPSH